MIPEKHVLDMIGMRHRVFGKIARSKESCNENDAARAPFANAMRVALSARSCGTGEPRPTASRGLNGESPWPGASTTTTVPVFTRL